MKKTNFPCPCGGKLKWKKEKVIQQGIDCGILDVEICEKCGEEYFPDESMGIIEQRLKEAGLWGVKRKEIKFWKTGNTVSIRLPTDFSVDLNLQSVKKGFIYQDGEHKISIDY